MGSHCLMGMKFQIGKTKRLCTGMVTAAACGVAELPVTGRQAHMAKRPRAHTTCTLPKVFLNCDSAKH